MNGSEIIYNIAIWALPVLFAITLHEAAHGWVANRLGDPTARMLGRLTLNPIKHIDPLGTVVIPIILMVVGGFIFGWAKPVPVSPRNLKNPQKDMAIVAAAGPMSNFLMAIFWLMLMWLTIYVIPHGWLTQPLVLMGQAGVTINLILMVLNLLPLPPLDGGRVVSGFLPPAMADSYNRIEPYGIWILLLLLVTGILGKIIWPIVLGLGNILYSVFSI